MRLTDLLGLPLAALWQQKSRTALTTLGVIFGSFVLAASLSIGQGVQDTIDRLARQRDVLRKINVGPKWGAADPDAEREVEVPGDMSDARRKRLRRALAQRKSQGPRVMMTRETLQTLSGLEHVDEVVPITWQQGFALLGDETRPAETAQVHPARPGDTFWQGRLIAGRFFETGDEPSAVLSEFLLYRWGLIYEAAAGTVIGKKVRLEYRTQRRQSGLAVYLMHPGGRQTTREEAAALDKVRQQLPAVLDRLDLTPDELGALRKALEDPPEQGSSDLAPQVVSEEFTIVGVVRLSDDDDRNDPWAWEPLHAEGDVLLPFETATELYFRGPLQALFGVDQAILTVDHEDHVRDVVQKIKNLDLNANAPLEFIEHERLLYLLIFAGMTCVAGVALLVAALGIANTMLISVLERTREIGIMKAVGAANGHVLFIFLFEGALIGLAGGACGLGLARGISIPGDAWVRSMVSRNLVNVELKESLFVFPPWLALAVLSFAALVTTLAAVYPARRAARIDPVAALRHE